MRLQKFQSALGALGRVIELSRQRPLSEAEQAGLIQFFELSWDVGWKVLRDKLDDQGVVLDIVAPIPVIRAAFSANIIGDGDGWVLAAKARNLLSHVYDEALVTLQIRQITDYYYPMMLQTFQNLDKMP
jgi:nucleotidyltransferase substrate binding protein (TIGR01987 family)